MDLLGTRGVESVTGGVILTAGGVTLGAIGAGMTAGIWGVGGGTGTAGGSGVGSGGGAATGAVCGAGGGSGIGAVISFQQAGQGPVTPAMSSGTDKTAPHSGQANSRTPVDIVGEQKLGSR